MPLSLYAPEDLMPRAVQLAFETGVIVYDALFLELVEDAETVLVTSDGKLLKTLQGTSYVRLAPPWPTSVASSPVNVEDRGYTATVLQPGQYEAVRGGQKPLAESPKTA